MKSRLYSFSVSHSTYQGVRVGIILLSLANLVAFYFFIPLAFADSTSDNPIVFVTMVPNPNDFGTLAATFGNHVPNPNTAYRGGDLWIRYPDGSLKNLTQSAGYGNSGFQGATSIVVRDPSVHWDGGKIIFSMIVGAATQRYQVTNYRWQLYEVTGIGQSETPVLTKVPNQPTDYNNHSPIYDSNDKIIFVSDRPRDNSILHTYPQRDEYESSPVNSGLWKLDVSNGALELLDHAPSGDFNPSIDSFGRVIFTRWDHLQRDQQNVGVSHGAFNYESELSTVQTSSAPEVFPEPRSNQDPDKKANVNLFTINQFIPWAMNQDGTDVETINHIGRQEIGLYSERSFNDDPNVQEFYGQYSTGQNQNEFTIFLHIKEDPTSPGTYFGTNCQEFGTHSGGQILKMHAPKGANPDNMTVTYLTHPDTAGASNSPSPNHSGLYRDPLPLTNGKLLAVHTAETRQDSNIGTSTNPISRYDYRLKVLTKPGTYYSASSAVTGGITKSINFWSPDEWISYNGPLWEMMPVEVVSRTRPSATSLAVPAIESGVISSLGVSIEELKSFLTSRNLALVVSRNLTSRDKNDRQQPTNLRVNGTSTQKIPNAGKIYDISKLEFFQGDLIRGYSSGGSNGRRVLAQRMHSVEDGINPLLVGANTGSVQIAEDGSMAAFVPARRALSWQIVDPVGEPVVRERYWVTFQPGEIRVCASCHGVNSSDQTGDPAPTNPPLALAQLIAHWKNLPMPTPTAAPTSTPGGGGDGGNSQYSISIKGQPKIVANGKFQLSAKGGATDDLSIRISVGKLACSGRKTLAKGSVTRTLNGRFPKLSRSKIKFDLVLSNSVKSSKSITLPKKIGLRTVTAKKACQQLIGSLKQ